MDNNQLMRAKHYTTWEIIKLYWQSEQRSSAYFFMIIVLTMTMAIVALDVIFNYWYNYFYDALQAYDKKAVIRLLGIFAIIATIHILLAVYRFYLSQLFAWRWRRWLTAQFVGRWLHDRTYYYLENFDERTDNPDQRIQEDVGALVSSTIDLTIGLSSAIATLIAFIYILWQLSGLFHLDLGSWGKIPIPGYLVWVSVIYASLGTYFTVKLGRPLVPLTFEQQRREADFRFAAVDLRRHAEHVALYRGEKQQQNILQQLFGRVLDNWYFIIARQKMLLWFTAGYNQLAIFLPLAVALPNYFEKVFLLGGLMQSLRAFGSVQESLSFIVNAYPQIAQWQAIARRLTTFVNHMDDVDVSAHDHDHVAFSRHPQDIIHAKGLTVSTPQGSVLLKNVNEEFIHGQHYLIKGSSGMGKSTFVRTLAGIWPYASGEVGLPDNKKIMYLPQQPYMPLGTLAEAMLFPTAKDEQLEAQLAGVLRDTHLGHLIPRLYDTAPWSEQLSPGEQQRIAFARVLLHKPDWVFLDESTSMLDLKNETYLYELLKSRVPHCSLVSVGHRPTLDVFHDHVIDMAQYGH